MDAKKQTALEYFLTGIYDLKIIKLDDNDKINQLSDLYHEAIAMEKHQIMDAYDNGEDRRAELYYFTNYGK